MAPKASLKWIHHFTFKKKYIFLLHVCVCICVWLSLLFPLTPADTNYTCIEICQTLHNRYSNQRIHTKPLQPQQWHSSMQFMFNSSQLKAFTQPTLHSTTWMVQCNASVRYHRNCIAMFDIMLTSPCIEQPIKPHFIWRKVEFARLFLKTASGYPLELSQWDSSYKHQKSKIRQK